MKGHDTTHHRVLASRFNNNVEQQGAA